MAKFTRLKSYDAEQWFPGDGELNQRLGVGDHGRGAFLTGSIYFETVEPGDWVVINDKGERGVYPDAEFRANFTPAES